jgi:hypothetical protein
MHLKFGTLHSHVEGELAFVQGSFLAVFSVEFVLCSACDLSLPFFGFGHELTFFVFYFFLPSFSKFHLLLCVVNALIKGEIEDQECPGGRWMTAPQ